MKFKGIENDCFLRLVASRESGLNLSGTRLMILWAANSETYNITNQQLAYESGMKASNVSRELRLICEAEWLVGHEIKRNKWDQSVNRYALHQKRMEQIQEMVKEYKSEKIAEVGEVTKPEETKPSGNQPLNALEQHFNDFVLKYKLKDKPSRVEHGNDVCKLFFSEVKSKNINLTDLEVLKSKYIGLFCHKSKQMADQQFEDWKSELSASWDRCLKDVFGEQILKVIGYMPNLQNVSLIESMFTETDWLNAYKSWSLKYNGVALVEFKSLYARDFDIDIQDNWKNNTPSTVSQILENMKSRNQRFALVWDANRPEQKSTQITGAMPKHGNTPQTSKKHREAIVDGDNITTEHLSYDKRTSYVFMTNEARALKKLREAKGLSMKKAGELLGYSDSYISQIENGRENVPVEERLLKFLETYEVDTRAFNKVVRELETDLTDLQVIKEILPRLNPTKLKLLRTVAEGFLKGN